MYVEKVVIENFRNYESLELNLNPRVNLILGKNGDGKTNLLEAIYFALSGYPIRFADNQDLIRHSTEFSRIGLKIRSQEVESLLQAQIIGQKRKMILNDKSVSFNRLNELFHAVKFTPESLAAVKEGPAQRRELFDEISKTLNPSASSVLSDYKKCLASRNQLLKSGLTEATLSTHQRHLLESLDESFLPLAAEVSWARIQAVSVALPVAKEAYCTLLKDTSVDLGVEYIISHHSAIDWSKNQVYDLLASRLKDLQATEIRAGMSLVGPHKHDVKFLVSGQDARVFCSQGQQRAIALAFKIAQVHLHKMRRSDEAILLLDDVFSELDTIRREQLLAILSQLRGQIILTAIDDSAPALKFGSDVSIFHISKGHVI